jgi:hypothetical protein
VVQEPTVLAVLDGEAFRQVTAMTAPSHATQVKLFAATGFPYRRLGYC